MDKEIIQKDIEKLPQEIKDYFAKNTWPQKLSLVAQVNKINEEQESLLKGEIFLILLGIENISDFETNVRNNVTGIQSDLLLKIVNEVKTTIFSEIKNILLEIEKNNLKIEANEENPSKDTVLNEIENPIPTKPIVSNPAGKNIVLDAQHNLPEQDKKILISSAAVPSRGPILGNFVGGFVMKTTTPAIPKIVPPIQEQQPQPQQIPQVPKPFMQPVSQQVPAPIKTITQTSPEDPKKYSVDPYREPIA